ncbi:hypothetical protein LCGC14_1587620 [marine sediment metagenome]|uniref:Uncharacterized protein n=1 Tax=marine sediment metagenome TaxID=412755 RepID=A0A0F9KVM3_9ZZZZ
MYRTIKYHGESLKKLKSVIEEIEERDEHIIIFTIETWEE